MSNTETAVTGTVSGARNRWNATDLGLIAVFAALACLSSRTAAKDGKMASPE